MRWVLKGSSPSGGFALLVWWLGYGLGIFLRLLRIAQAGDMKVGRLRLMRSPCSVEVV
jgi:hypothetical protein